MLSHPSLPVDRPVPRGGSTPYRNGTGTALTPAALIKAALVWALGWVLAWRPGLAMMLGRCIWSALPWLRGA